MTPAERLEALAKRVRARYCAEYRSFEDRNNGRKGSTYGIRSLPSLDGGVDNWGKRYRPFWPELAKYCLDKGINPDLLIWAYFEERQGGDIPRARDLLSPKALTMYARAHKRQQEDVAIACRAEQENAGRRFRLLRLEKPDATEERLWRLVLTDPVADFSSLFRYCLASSVGAMRLASTYREAAFWQYLRSPRAYDEALAGLIPNELVEEAARVYETTLQ